MRQQNNNHDVMIVMKILLLILITVVPPCSDAGPMRRSWARGAVTVGPMWCACTARRPAKHRLITVVLRAGHKAIVNIFSSHTTIHSLSSATEVFLFGYHAFLSNLWQIQWKDITVLDFWLLVINVFTIFPWILFDSRPVRCIRMLIHQSSRQV